MKDTIKKTVAKRLMSLMMAFVMIFSLLMGISEVAYASPRSDYNQIRREAWDYYNSHVAYEDEEAGEDLWHILSAYEDADTDESLHDNSPEWTSFASDISEKLEAFKAFVNDHPEIAEQRLAQARLDYTTAYNSAVSYAGQISRYTKAYAYLNTKITEYRIANLDSCTDLRTIENNTTGITSEETDVKKIVNVDALIEALPEASSVTVSHQTAIENADRKYNNLWSTEKSLVEDANVEKLTAVKTALARALSSAEDNAAAAEVDGLINSLPSTTLITIGDESSIQTARTKYTALTDDQKGLVSKLNTLTAAEQALTAVKNAKTDYLTAYNNATAYRTTANRYTEILNSLNSAISSNEVSSSAYNSTTKSQFNTAQTALENALNEAKSAVAYEEAVGTVNSLIENLPSPENITYSDKESVEAAEEAFANLNDEKKALVRAENKTKLINVRTKLDQVIAAKNAEDLANAKRNYENQLSDARTYISQISTDYEDIANELKSKVDAIEAGITENSTKSEYDSAKSNIITAMSSARTAVYYIVKASLIEEYFNTLSDVNEYSKQITTKLGNNNSFDTAVAEHKYSQRELERLGNDEITSEINTLNELMGTYSESMINYFVTDIYSLPSSETMQYGDIPRVEAIKRAYDRLSETQKLCVTNYSVLEGALANVESIRTNEAAYEKAHKEISDYILLFRESEPEKAAEFTTFLDHCSVSSKEMMTASEFENLTEACKNLLKEAKKEFEGIIPEEERIANEKKAAEEAARLAAEKKAAEEAARLAAEKKAQEEVALNAAAEAAKKAAEEAAKKSEETKKEEKPAVTKLITYKGSVVAVDKDGKVVEKTGVVTYNGHNLLISNGVLYKKPAFCMDKTDGKYKLFVGGVQAKTGDTFVNYGGRLLHVTNGELNQETGFVRYGGKLMVSYKGAALTGFTGTVTVKGYKVRIFKGAVIGVSR